MESPRVAGMSGRNWVSIPDYIDSGYCQATSIGKWVRTPSRLS